MIESKVENFRISDKQVVTGPAMLPNTAIYRYDVDNDEEYYVYFSPKTIENLAMKFLGTDGNTRAVDLQHDGQRVEAFIFESWIVRNHEDKIYEYYEHDEVPLGSWCVSMKIEDPEVWQMVKDGYITGYSVSGLFSERVEQYCKDYKEQIQLEQIIDILEQVKG